MPSRLKREDCPRTKHDSIFSAWKILVGPSDWEDHATGKEGVQRYRVHNLPANSSCPGIYELGVTLTFADECRKTRKHDLDDIVVVYIGQADNVKSRLQHYGRTGSHLDCGSSFVFSSENKNTCFKAGFGLFREIFAKGYSLAFRWAPMSDKKEAVKAEAQLLGVFDYAWNRLQNGYCRREEIILRLDNAVTSRKTSLLGKLHRWKHITFGGKVGIKISGNGSHSTSGSSNGMQNFLPRVRKLVNYRPQLVQVGNKHNGDHDMCGIPTDSLSVCKNRSVRGDHRDEKITLNDSTIHEATAKESSAACGVTLEDGSSCLAIPVQGRKRCELHKGRRKVKPKPKVLSDSKPFNGMENSSIRSQCQVMEKTEEMHGFDNTLNICGVETTYGICRRRPVAERKRCEEHKGMRTTGSRFTQGSGSPRAAVSPSICGAATLDGSLCMNAAVTGRKRCAQHKGRRAG
ncbi:protein EFFECTOR OF TRANSCRIPTION 2-like [Typha latifolia]|uniref:protein EFFECTOR OF TRANSCRIPTION 2-like n=1 Tax=Typha latifolia TaxID=4733 RepID=UPI003C2EAA0F